MPKSLKSQVASLKRARGGRRASGTRRQRPAASRAPSRRPRASSEPTIEELEQAGATAFQAGSFDRASAAFRAILERLRRAGSPSDADITRLEAEVELRLGASLRRSGALRTARISVERSIAAAPTARTIQAAAHVLLSELHLLRGNRPLAELSADKALELTAAYDDLARAWGLCQRGRILWAEQFYEDARQSFLQAHGSAVRHADAANAAHIAGNVGMCLLELGQLADARTWVARAVDDAGAASAPAVEARWLVGLARVALAEGALEEADRLAERALEIGGPLAHHLTVFRAEWLRHYLTSLSAPGTRDRSRMAVLKGLRSRLADFKEDREMQQLEQALRSRGGPTKGIASFTEGCDPIPSREASMTTLRGS